MYKFSLTCVLVVLLVSEGFGVPQGRRVRQPVVQQPAVQQPAVQQQVPLAHQLDPTAADQEMNHEHAKLIENLQRLKRTLDTVKERVGKGGYGAESMNTADVKNPEGAILTVLKSLQEQGQLFSMINDMLKAGSEVQNQTAKIEAISHHHEQALAEAANAENTNHIAPAQVTPSIKAAARKDKDIIDAGKHHGYDDYQYQYRDEAGDSTGDDQYEYQYDAGGYESAHINKAPITTTTTTTTKRPKRYRTRGRNDYY